MAKTKEELQKRHHEILCELDKMDELAWHEKRSLNDEEIVKYKSLLREDERLHCEIRGMLDAKGLQELDEQMSASKRLREIFLKCRNERTSYAEDVHDREGNATTILKDPATGNTKGNLVASGAIPLVINPIIDTKVPGFERPDDLPILLGVTANQVWPYAIDDVEFTVAGEVEKIGEQNINFDKVTASPVRVAAALAVSNLALDSAAFNLYDFCNFKMTKGLAKFEALYSYGHFPRAHALKPVFSLVDVEEIVLDENFGKNLGNKIAQMWNLGFEGEPWITFDKEIENELMFLKRVPGQTGDRTVVEDGRCIGYKYTVSPFINYGSPNTETDPASDGDHYIGIGHWRYLAFQQHGNIRLSIDATSAEVSARNVCVLTLNTEFSLTELSSKVNGNTSGKPQAFKLLRVVQPSSSNEIGG